MNLMNFIFFNMLLLTILATLKKTPLSMMMCIILQTMNMTMLIYSLNIMSWYSFMLMMVFLSGMTIIFMYISSLATNKIFHKKKIFLSTIPIILLITFFSEWYSTSNIMMNSINKNYKPNMSNMYSMYSNFNSNLIILFMLYLLLTLIVVVKLTMNNKGPMKMNI